MSIKDTILTNTILMPASDGLAESNQLEPLTIVSDLTKFNTNFEKKSQVLANDFKVYIGSGEKTVQVAYCQKIMGLELRRQYESTKAGGNALYTINMPGFLSNSEVHLVHTVTDNEIFLNWLINGTGYGGVQRADIELRTGDDQNYVQFTFRDAFPTKWTFGTMALNVRGFATNEDIVTYTMKDGDIMVENITLVYGKLEYKVVGG